MKRGPAFLFFIFRFEYLISGPKSYRDFRETGPWPFISRVAKYVGNVAMFAYAMKGKKNFVVRALCTRPRRNGSQSLSRADDWCQAEK